MDERITAIYLQQLLRMHSMVFAMNEDIKANYKDFIMYKDALLNLQALEFNFNEAADLYNQVNLYNSKHHQQVIDEIELLIKANKDNIDKTVQVDSSIQAE